MEGKRIGLLVTGADAYENNVEGLFNAFDRIANFLLTRKAESCMWEVAATLPICLKR